MLSSIRPGGQREHFVEILKSRKFLIFFKFPKVSGQRAMGDTLWCGGAQAVRLAPDRHTAGATRTSVLILKNQVSGFFIRRFFVETLMFF